jgi:hypothetical protein
MQELIFAVNSLVLRKKVGLELCLISTIPKSETSPQLALFYHIV